MPPPSPLPVLAACQVMSLHWKPHPFSSHIHLAIQALPMLKPHSLPPQPCLTCHLATPWPQAIPTLKPFAFVPCISHSLPQVPPLGASPITQKDRKAGAMRFTHTWLYLYHTAAPCPPYQPCPLPLGSTPWDPGLCPPPPPKSPSPASPTLWALGEELSLGPGINHYTLGKHRPGRGSGVRVSSPPYTPFSSLARSVPTLARLLPPPFAHTCPSDVSST